jgi:hypothetical protein
MTDTVTERGLILPAIGSTGWGVKLNANFQQLETIFNAAGGLPLASLIQQLQGMTIRQAVEYLLTLQGGPGTIPAINVTFDNANTGLQAENVQAALPELAGRSLLFNEESFTVASDGQRTFTLSGAADALLYVRLGGVDQPLGTTVFNYPAVTIASTAALTGMSVQIGTVSNFGG